MEIRNFGYYWLDTWVLANVIQLATQDFCLRHLNRTNDPFGVFLALFLATSNFISYLCRVIKQ